MKQKGVPKPKWITSTFVFADFVVSLSAHTQKPLSHRTYTARAINATPRNTRNRALWQPQPDAT